MINTKKIGSVLKNLQISEDLELNDEINAQEGQLIAVKVISVNPNYNKLELISALVKMNESIVAKFGAIIPDPFAIAEILISSSPIIISS